MRCIEKVDGTAVLSLAGWQGFLRQFCAAKHIHDTTAEPHFLCMLLLVWSKDRLQTFFFQKAQKGDAVKHIVPRLPKPAQAFLVLVMSRLPGCVGTNLVSSQLDVM